MKEHSRSFFHPHARNITRPEEKYVSLFRPKSCDNCILFHAGNLNFELTKHSTYGGGGSGRVRLFAGNSGSGRVSVSPGWVQEKSTVDNSEVDALNFIVGHVVSAPLRPAVYLVIPEFNQPLLANRSNILEACTVLPTAVTAGLPR